MLRTAFLAYVRVLLCLQGMYLVLFGWGVFSGRGPGQSFWWLLGIALIATCLGLPEIVTAVLLRRGRRGAAIAAVVIETLWAAAAAVIGHGASTTATPMWPFLAGAALFLVAAAGLLLPPLRVYAGLIRR